MLSAVVAFAICFLVLFYFWTNGCNGDNDKIGYNMKLDFNKM